MPSEKQAGSALISPLPDIDKHEADLARRAELRQKKRPLLLDCLDPTVAKYHEDRKELYEFRVEVKIFRPAVGKAAAHLEAFDEQVVALNEQDAWAFFCDKIGEWPSPRDSHPVITKLKKRTLRGDAN